MYSLIRLTNKKCTVELSENVRRDKNFILVSRQETDGGNYRAHRIIAESDDKDYLLSLTVNEYGVLHLSPPRTPLLRDTVNETTTSSSRAEATLLMLRKGHPRVNPSRQCSRPMMATTHDEALINQNVAKSNATDDTLSREASRPTTLHSPQSLSPNDFQLSKRAGQELNLEDALKSLVTLNSESEKVPKSQAAMLTSVSLIPEVSFPSSNLRTEQNSDTFVSQERRNLAILYESKVRQGAIPKTYSSLGFKSTDTSQHAEKLTIPRSPATCIPCTETSISTVFVPHNDSAPPSHSLTHSRQPILCETQDEGSLPRCAMESEFLESQENQYKINNPKFMCGLQGEIKYHQTAPLGKFRRVQMAQTVSHNLMCDVSCTNDIGTKTTSKTQLLQRGISQTNLKPSGPTIFMSGCESRTAADIHKNFQQPLKSPSRLFNPKSSTTFSSTRLQSGDCSNGKSMPGFSSRQGESIFSSTVLSSDSTTQHNSDFSLYSALSRSASQREPGQQRQARLRIPRSPTRDFRHNDCVSLIRGSSTFINRESLKQILKDTVYRPNRTPDAPELVRQLMKSIIGIPQLMTMTAKGNPKKNLREIPPATYRTVLDYVNTLLPKYQLDSRIYRTIITQMCNDLRNPRR